MRSKAESTASSVRTPRPGSRDSTAHRPPTDFERLAFDVRRSADQDAAVPVRHPVVVVGAGPVGLTLAIDLAQRGVPVVLLDNDHTLAKGSRAICFAKRTLEIFDRLGCGDRMASTGVAWQRGRVFFRDAEVYHFDLLAEVGHERPAFVNLQQYYVEGFLVERAAELPLIDLRWRHAVVGVQPQADGVRLEVETPEGRYAIVAAYVAACDGSRSPMREALGLSSRGRAFRDRFLIADVRMQIDLPAERWFWFDPTFHPNQSALLHRQPDGVWRIDFQLGWDADPEEAKKPERIAPLVRAMLAGSGLGEVPFELVWASVYSFACTRMERFRHGRILFAGDAAHGVSPFGARGANSGVQDADNLGWKLALVLQRHAPAALLDTYGDEREAASDDNIRHSTRATDFISPKSEISRVFRDAVLDLSRTHPFARKLVNSGRLSMPSELVGSPLNTDDSADFDGAMRPGAAAADAPVLLPDGSPGWLLRQLGEGFTAIVYGDEHPGAAERIAAIVQPGVPLKVLHIRPCGTAPHPCCAASLTDADGHVAERYDLLPGTVYLLRPDGHVCARWRERSVEAVQLALQRALALTGAAAA